MRLKNEIEVIDNFLNDNHLHQLDELINNPYFAWYLQKEQVEGYGDSSFFSHLLYDWNKPQSDLYDSVIGIFEDDLKSVSLCRITINLLLKKETLYPSAFHTDFRHMSNVDEGKITTAIFYLNTTNGATEFKGGDKIDCVRNRFVKFPALTSHRAIGQTDVNERIIINFNYV